MRFSPALISLLEGRPPRGTMEHLLTWGLRPWGAAYGAGTMLRARAYARGMLPVHQPPCPVISIGNLASGGTGKTPMTLWLVRRLKEMGWRPAVVSRGYGQDSRQVVTVVSDGAGQRLHPPLAADEAALLADRLPDIPILCAPQRHHGVTLATELLGCNLVVLDDGFQHLAMARTCDIVLLDGQNPWGNGRILPAGILREPASALGRAHLVVLTRCQNPTLSRATTTTLTQRWPHLPVVPSDHRATGWRLPDGTPSPPPPSPVLAFCGIARPDSFTRSIEESGATLAGCQRFADHHPYTAADLDNLTRQARALGAAALVCTAKDAVKIRRHPCPLPIHFLEMDLFFPEGATLLLEELGRLLPPLPEP